jgi:hypothetical protein
MRGLLPLRRALCYHALVLHYVPCFLHDLTQRGICVLALALIPIPVNSTPETNPHPYSNTHPIQSTLPLPSPYRLNRYETRELRTYLRSYSQNPPSYCRTPRRPSIRCPRATRRRRCRAMCFCAGRSGIRRWKRRRARGRICCLGMGLASLRL